jgi:hypothetical protein
MIRVALFVGNHDLLTSVINMKRGFFLTYSLEIRLISVIILYQSFEYSFYTFMYFGLYSRVNFEGYYFIFIKKCELFYCPLLIYSITFNLFIYLLS